MKIKQLAMQLTEIVQQGLLNLKDFSILNKIKWDYRSCTIKKHNYNLTPQMT